MPNYDTPLTISTAPQRYAKKWQHTETTWQHLVERLRTPTRTGETAAEYKAMGKAARDQRKDVGGYVCGRLKDGKRLKQNVLYRQVVTLDADSPDKDFAADADLALGGIAYAIYSTHSHTPTTPRLRLLIPLARTVQPDEYQSIARRLAADVGIEAFDPTTYEPERLMYWPSCPQDGEYVFLVNDGPILDPQTVLDRYDDWQDMSVWPTSRKETGLVQRDAKKQGDPLTKPGLIGAFCRAYDIASAISTFLPEVYMATGHPDRYTYAKGSTTGGLVVYDGKFAYSHHGTDPSSGKLCNAFDLVRLHLYGDQDEEAAEGTPVTKLPSYTAMCQRAREDKPTVHELNETDLAELKQMFLEAGEEADTSWVDNLARGPGKDSPILPCAENFLLILTHDPLLKDRFGLDLFSHRLVLRGDLPWRTRQEGVTWRDADDSSLRNYLSIHYGLTSRPIIDDAVTEVMNRHSFHPVRDYLKELMWDGNPRADTLYIDFLGAEDSEYVRTVTRLHLRAAVARVMVPGIKFDPCLVLSGPQGIGKSTILDRLGKQWFNDSITSIQGKDAMEALQGSWLLELSEMQAANKAENDQIKAFLSKQVDKFRAPYGKRTEEFPRQCVFAATTNDSIFLKDRTGSRRFWPVFCTGEARKSLDELTAEYVNQVWAEVYTGWKSDGSLLLPEAVAKVAADLQEAHTEGSEKAGLIEDYLDRLLPEKWESMEIYERNNWLTETVHGTDEEGTVQRDKVCALEIWCEAFGGRKQAFNNFNAREINIIMQSMPGWKPYGGKSKRGKLRFGNFYGVQRAFIRRGSKYENQ